MPKTPREIVTFVIVSVLLCGVIASVSTQFDKGYRSHRQEYTSTTTATPAVAGATTINKDDPPAAAAKERRLAPAGVFFLSERVALTTKSGIVAFAPGTCVQLVSTNGDRFRVTDGTTTLDVSKNKLTNDVDLAAILAQSDYASQKAIAAHIGSEIELHRRMVDIENAQHERELNAIEANRREAQRIQNENVITPAEADILNLREVHRDMNGNIIYGWATDGLSVGPGKVRSFREQAELVKRHKLPELTTDERRERWREDYTYTQQHKTPDAIIINRR